MAGVLEIPTNLRLTPAPGITPTWTGLHTFAVNPIIRNTAPTLTLTDSTGGAEGLTIVVDANVADLRASDSASGSLLALDLANNRLSLGAVPGIANRKFYLEHHTAETAAPSSVEITGFYTAARIDGTNTQNLTNSAGGFAAWNLDQRILSGATGTLTNWTGLYLGFWANQSAMTVSNAYGGKITAMANSGGGTVSKLAGWAIADQTVGTDRTNLLLGTTTIPAGIWSLYNSSTANNYIGGNLGLGVTAWGTNAAKVLGLGLGVEPGALADAVQLGCVDLSPGNATLMVRTETAVAVDAGLVSTHSLSVRVNGATYKIPLIAA
jgi:hypothetical protein